MKVSIGERRGTELFREVGGIVMKPTVAACLALSPGTRWSRPFAEVGASLRVTSGPPSRADNWHLGHRGVSTMPFGSQMNEGTVTCSVGGRSLMRRCGRRGPQRREAHQSSAGSQRREPASGRGLGQITGWQSGPSARPPAGLPRCIEITGRSGRNQAGQREGFGHFFLPKWEDYLTS